MEEQSNHEKHVKFMSAFDTKTNIVPYLLEDNPNQELVMQAGRNENHLMFLPLPQWMYNQQTSFNYVDFMAENATYDHKASINDTGGETSWTIGGTRPLDGVSEILSEVPGNDSEKAHDLMPAVSNHNMVAWNVLPSLYISNSNNLESSISGNGFVCSDQNQIVDEKRCSVPMVGYLTPHGELQPWNKFADLQIHAQANSAWTEQPSEDVYHVYEPRSRAASAALGIQLKPHYTKRASREKATETDRLRRLKIAQRLKAVQDLLPQPQEGCQTSVMEDIMDYIKNLQLQIKELSGSRLGPELTSDPLAYLEAYGHHRIHDAKLSKPLEEMIGNLLQTNPIAATQLLESRGLFMMPVALTEALVQPQ